MHHFDVTGHNSSILAYNKTSEHMPVLDPKHFAFHCMARQITSINGALLSINAKYNLTITKGYRHIQ